MPLRGLTSPGSDPPAARDLASWSSAPVGLDKRVRLPGHEHTVAEYLPRDRERGEADVASHSDRERSPALEAAGVDRELEVLYLRSADGLLSRGQTRGLCGLGARCSGSRESRLRCGRSERHVLAHHLAHCEDPKRQEEQDEGAQRPLDKRLTGLDSHDEPG